MRMFGSPAGTRMRLHKRGHFWLSRVKAKPQPQEPKPYTPEELRAFAKAATPPKPKPSLLGRALAFLKRKVV